MSSISTLLPMKRFLNYQTVIRMVPAMLLVMVSSGCSMMSCQQGETDPEADQQVVAKELAIPPNLIDPAMDNKPFNEAIKPASI